MLTLGDSRQPLWKYVSNVPFETAQDSDIKNFDAVLNRLCQRFLAEGSWKGCFRRVTLSTYGNTITLPRNLSVCLGCDPLCPNTTDSWSGFPLRIYSRWFEFAAQGPGMSSSCVNGCAIRGLIPVSDLIQTFADPTGTFYLRAKSTKASGRGFTFSGGLDENEDAIAGNVKLEIANGTTTTTQQYTEMPRIEKAMTGAYVEFYSVDTTTAEETLLCVYAPSETNPDYKRYIVPNAEDGDQFSCLCKLAFVPAVNDSDLIIPDMMDALILGLMSIQFRDKTDPERSALYMGPNYPGKGDSTAKPVMAGAIDVLDSDLAEDEGAEIPMFNFPTSYGAGNIWQVR